MSTRTKALSETDTAQQEPSQLEAMIREAEAEIERREHAEHESYDALLAAHKATLGGNGTGDIIELRAAYQHAQAETAIMRDVLQRLRGDLVMAQNRADQAQHAAERDENVARWNQLADEHIAYLGQFEGAVEALRASLEGMYQVGVQQERLAEQLQLNGPAQPRVNHSHFKSVYLDNYLSLKLDSVLTRLRMGFSSATHTLKSKTLSEVSPFARKLT